MNPRLEGAVLSAASGNYPAPHTGGFIVLSAALVGALSLTTSSGAITVVPAGTSGTWPVPASGGAPNTGWLYANPADIGKALLMVATPNAFLRSEQRP